MGDNRDRSGKRSALNLRANMHSYGYARPCFFATCWHGFVFFRASVRPSCLPRLRLCGARASPVHASCDVHACSVRKRPHSGETCRLPIDFAASRKTPSGCYKLAPNATVPGEAGRNDGGRGAAGVRGRRAHGNRRTSWQANLGTRERPGRASGRSS